MAEKPSNGPKTVDVHSQPLPTRSCTPQALAPAGRAPAGTGLQDAKSKWPRVRSGGADPHGYPRSPPDGDENAARWYSASVSNRRPFDCANAVAASWLT